MFLLRTRKWIVSFAVKIGYTHTKTLGCRILWGAVSNFL